MEEVEAEHRQEDHGTIHSVEVEFSGDDPAGPTICEFDGSVHGSDVDGEGAEGNSKKHRLHLLVHEVVAGRWLIVRTLEGFVVEVTVEKLDGEDHVHGDGDHLEDNAAQHDSTAHCWIFVVTSGDGSEGTTDTLNGESDHIGGEEDDGIWR